MKRAFLIISIIFTSTFSFGQNFEELGNYEFKTVESYETEEHNVLMCANYLFNNPANKAEINRLNSIRYIMNWMQGTPDYTFEITEKAMELTKGNPDLLGLYLAAMSKVVLENEGEELENSEMYSRAEDILVNYCSQPDNKIKPSKKIKKIIKSRKG